MQIQRINSNTNFGLYERGLIHSLAHEKVLDALHPKLSQIGKKVHLFITSGEGVVKRGSDYEITMPCLKISAWKKDTIYPITHSGDAFLNGANPQEEVMRVANRVADAALVPLPKHA